MKSTNIKKIILLLASTGIIQSMQSKKSTPAKPVKQTVATTVSNTNASTTTSTLSGIFYAPSGIGIVLQNNGKNDLTITPKKETDKTVNITNFNFPTPLANGTKFNINTKKFLVLIKKETACIAILFYLRHYAGFYTLEDCFYGHT